MAAWRMAMRGRIHPADGSWLEQPREMWALCRERGVAAITYEAVKDDDFSNFSQQNPPPGWQKLASPQKVSLKRFIYEMQVGDTIYVKEGPQIVGKGVVRSDYQFDYVDPIPGALGTFWRHQRPVEWDLNFQPREVQIGNPQIVTVVSLNSDDVAKVEAHSLE